MKASNAKQSKSSRLANRKKKTHVSQCLTEVFCALRIKKKGRSLGSKNERVDNQHAKKKPCQEHCSSDPVVLKQEETLMSKHQEEPHFSEVLTMHGF